MTRSTGPSPTRIDTGGKAALAFTVGVGGALAFIGLGLPLPWLLGPMVAALALSLAGGRTPAMGKLSAPARAILGVAIGASITPELLGRLDEIAFSLALLPFYVAAIGLVGVPYFRRLCGFDPPTAYFSAMPGGLQDMVAFGEEAGANLRALSLVHATRIFAIVAALPFILEGFYGAEIAGADPPGQPAVDIPLVDLAVMLVCMFGGWLGAARVGLFGPTIIGPLIAAAIATQLGLLSQRPPEEAIILSQVILGLDVGAKYAGVTAAEVKSIVLAALGFCVLLTGLATLFEQAAVALGLAPPLEALLAFAPGGQGEMVILALVVGADVAFVAAHHVTRVVIVIAGAPLAHRLMKP